MTKGDEGEAREDEEGSRRSSHEKIFEADERHVWIPMEHRPLKAFVSYNIPRFNFRFKTWTCGFNPSLPLSSALSFPYSVFLFFSFCYLFFPPGLAYRNETKIKNTNRALVWCF